MKPLVRFILTLGVFLAHIFPSKAGGQYDSYTSLHEKDSAIVQSFTIRYKVDSIDICPNYHGNREQMDHIIHYLENSPRIDSIVIYAYSSPEGRYSKNQWLSKERANSVRKFLLEHSLEGRLLSLEKLHVTPIAENWQGLARIVEENYTRADREQVLDILYDADISDQIRKTRLQNLDNGLSWRYLIDNYMSQLRTATLVCVWAEPMPVLASLEIKSDSLVSHRGTIVMPQFQGKSLPADKKMLFAARTNLLLPALNVGLEFPIRSNWSLGIDYYYPWAVSEENRWCGEMLGLFVDAKYWIPGDKYQWTKSQKLQGHAVGVYAGAGYYDYQNVRHGYQGEYIDTGVDYTFALPVGPKDNKWMRVEFNLGFGWIRTWATPYSPSDDFSQLVKDPDVKRQVFDYFGPTKASVSFVVPFSYRIKGGSL